MAKVAKKISAYPPLNLAYLAAIARLDGHSVQIIDGELECLGEDQIMSRLRSFQPDLIGFTTTTPGFHIVLNFAKRIKEEFKTPIVVGGPHVTFYREKIFNEHFDYLVVGQCENTFAAFLRAVEQGSGFAEVAGIIYRENGKVAFTGENPQVDDLDTIPFPARDLLRMDLYELGTMRGRKGFTAIMTSRGCPFKCVFCSTSIYGNRVRRRAIPNIIAEIKEVVSKYGIRHFYFLDETLTLSRKYIHQLCNAIEEARLDITWEGGTRPNLIDEPLIKRMVETGLIRIAFGFESADEKVRTIIRKDCSLKSYRTANELTSKYGLETINTVMIGLPGDTADSIRRTIKYVRNERTIKHATLGIAIPYPGSEMYEMAKNGEHGLRLETDDFSKYQRYNSAVMSVNGISPSQLLSIQKKGLLSIYLAPWRIIPVIKRMGFRSLIEPFFSALKELLPKI